MAPDEPLVHSTIDVRETTPALLWTRVKLQLEKLSYGERLAVQVDQPEGIERIPEQARREGHKVVDVRVIVGGGYEIIIERSRQNFARAFMKG